MKSMFYFLVLVLSQNVYSSDTSMLLENEKNSISVYSKTVPSVVNVTNIKIAGNILFGMMEKIPAGLGTGFVWDTQGHIVTNYHVIEGGTEFVVSFYQDKGQYKAKVVGVEPRKDIAVLKLIEKPKTLTPISVGTSGNLLVGQKTIAIGNPFGFDYSMSTGIVSAIGRKMEGVAGFTITDVIQTDAAINQGNSGGPLLNSRGDVIGMNTLIVSPSGSSSGLGFSIPIDTIKRVVPQLIEHGKVIRPGLGIGIARQNMVKGAVISYIDEDGPAYKAGLRGMKVDAWGRTYIGDVILEIDGKAVETSDDIYLILDKHKVGDEVTIKYSRKEKTSSLVVKLTAV